MPRWDFYCEKCHATIELAFKSVEDASDARCAECSSKLTRQAASGSFTIRGYSAQNGYTRR